MKTKNVFCGLMLGLLLLAVQANLARAQTMTAAGLPNSAYPRLELWLDASTLAASTTSVSAWADRSWHMRNAVQTVAANQPTYAANNPIFAIRPTVHFDGNDILTSEFALAMQINAAQPRTIFVVFSQDTAANKNVVGFGANADAQLFDVLLVTNKFTGHFHGEGNDTIGATTQTYGIGQMTVGTIGYDGASVRTYQRNTSFNGILATKAIALNTGNSAFQVGAGVYPVYNNFVGHIAEILVYSEKLSDADRTAVEAYLFAKYPNGGAPIQLELFLSPGRKYRGPEQRQHRDPEFHSECAGGLRRSAHRDG